MTVLPVVLLLLLLLAGGGGGEALVVDVPSGRSKCLSDELRRGALSHASYRVAAATSGAASAVSARVTGPSGEAVHVAEGVEAGEFSFEAAEAGKYTACFWSPRFQLGASVSVDVQWATGVRAQAGGSPPAVEAAKKGHVEAIATELKKLEDSVRLIHEEMIFLREREGETERLNEDTTVRMHSFSLLSLVVCLGVAGLQLWHLKTFFQRRKILRTD